MRQYIIFIVSTLFLFSCTGQKQDNTTAASQQDTLAPPQVTILADLPDSLHPKPSFWMLRPNPEL
jgi:PBP1b-binding outer membrane lipoprotein LpoB